MFNVVFTVPKHKNCLISIYYIFVYFNVGDLIFQECNIVAQSLITRGFLLKSNLFYYTSAQLILIYFQLIFCRSTSQMEYYQTSRIARQSARKVCR